MVQVRRGATPQTGKPTYFFTKASELDPEEADYFFNLGYAYWLDKDAQAAIYWLREAVRRNTVDGDAHFVLGVALQAAGAPAESAARAGPGAAAVVEVRRVGEEAARATIRCRRRSSGPARTRDHARPAARRGAPRPAPSASSSSWRAFHLERGRRFYESEQDRDALIELRKAIYLSPYDAEPHLLLGRVLLRTGRPRTPSTPLRIAVWSRDSAAGRLALAEALLQIGGQSEAPGPRPTARWRSIRASAEAKALLARIDKP